MSRELLKGGGKMSVDWKTRGRVREFVAALAASPTEMFYPTAVANFDNSLKMEDVFAVLVELCESKELELMWEITCPNIESSCYRRIGIVPDYKEYLGVTVQCDICGKEFEIEEEDIFPIFKINPEYSTYIKEQARQDKKKSTLQIDADDDLRGQALKAVFANSTPTLSLGTTKQFLNIEQLIIVQGEGTVNSNNKHIKGSFNGSSFGEKSIVNIQSDNNTSTINVSDLPKDIFETLRSEISEKVTDEMDREQALEFAGNLEQAVQERDADKASKYVKWIEKIIEGSTAVATIVQAIQAFR